MLAATVGAQSYSPVCVAQRSTVQHETQIKHAKLLRHDAKRCSAFGAKTGAQLLSENSFNVVLSGINGLTMAPSMLMTAPQHAPVFPMPTIDCHQHAPPSAC